MGDDIESRLKRMIVERLFLRIQPDAIESDKSLIEVYGVDSVSLLELVVGLEEEFGVAIGERDFRVKHFETVAALAAFVRQRLAPGGTTGA